jgi:hypothetical protein
VTTVWRTDAERRAAELARQILWRYVDCDDCLINRLNVIDDPDLIREALRELCDELSLRFSS